MTTRAAQERILLVADARHEMEPVLSQAAPAARVTVVDDYFDAIAELAGTPYAMVLASAQPIERRPEAAVRTLRQLAPEGRLVLFAEPSLEPLARRMLGAGCDDYVLTPPSVSELQQVFAAPLLRIAAPAAPEQSRLVGTSPDAPALPELPGGALAELVLDALVQSPGDAPAACLRRINSLVAPHYQLRFHPGAADSAAPDDAATLSHPVRGHTQEAGRLELLTPASAGITMGDPSAARHFLAQMAHLMGKVVLLQDRHNGLQKLAINDHLTGVYNRRWFEHSLARILEKARTMRFDVTLLLFDIDDFKKYNDQFGHEAGDDILRQTAALMKRCCREHDVVARIGGDEFAVVFWEKEGPRQAKEPGKQPPLRPQQAAHQVFDRFRRLLATRDFPNLGAGGRGLLSISGGFASFPWDGREMAELVAAADRELMFAAKRQRKNSIFLVGDQGPDADGG